MQDVSKTLLHNLGGKFTILCFIIMLYGLLYYMDTTYISVCIKYYIIKKINIRKEYEAKTPIVPNLIISPKIHSFILWEPVETVQDQMNWSCNITAVHSFHKHQGAPTLNKTSLVLALALLELRV